MYTVSIERWPLIPREHQLELLLFYGENLAKYSDTETYILYSFQDFFVEVELNLEETEVLSVWHFREDQMPRYLEKPNCEIAA